MKIETPSKILITGGQEVGGVGSFAEGLADGFAALGIPSEIIPPSRILSRWRDLRDAKVLKILSATAVYAAPFARRVICMAHGFPRADAQGWIKFLAIISSYKLANFCSEARLVAVSDYGAIHLRSIFNLKVDAVIHNPLKPLFLETFDRAAQHRNYITYVGRLHPVKNLHRVLPAIHDLLKETPGLRACFIGDGEQRAELERMVNGDPNFEFKGSLDSAGVRGWLRRTHVFVSGCETEALGISYLEALSQGCSVVMPACGGGLEIAPELIGTRVHLLPLSFDRNETLAALRRALGPKCEPMTFAAYEAKVIAQAYLSLDMYFPCMGTINYGFRKPQAGTTGVNLSGHN